MTLLFIINFIFGAIGTFTAMNEDGNTNTKSAVKISLGAFSLISAAILIISTNTNEYKAPLVFLIALCLMLGILLAIRAMDFIMK